MATTDEPTARGVNRRVLMKGAVWTVPAVMVAAPAPAFAASCTEVYPATLNWATNYTRNSATSGTATITHTNGVQTVVTLSSTLTNYTAAAQNYTVTSPVGGTGGAGLTLQHQPNSYTTGVLFPQTHYYSGIAANNQTLTMSFNRPVYNIDFLFTDIDSTTGDFIDAVAVTGVTYTSSTPTGSTVTTGTGTVAAPFRQAGNNSAYDNGTSPGGNKRIQIAGPITAMTIQYWNSIDETTITATPDQAIFISNMTIGTHNTGCP